MYNVSNKIYIFFVLLFAMNRTRQHVFHSTLTNKGYRETCNDAKFIGNVGKEKRNGCCGGNSDADYIHGGTYSEYTNSGDLRAECCNGGEDTCNIPGLKW